MCLRGVGLPDFSQAPTFDTDAGYQITGSEVRISTIGCVQNQPCLAPLEHSDLPLQSTKKDATTEHG
jgi:hypothetical protein